MWLASPAALLCGHQDAGKKEQSIESCDHEPELTGKDLMTPAPRNVIHKPEGPWVRLVVR